MTYPDPDRAYGGSERRGPNIRLIPVARWWRRGQYRNGALLTTGRVRGREVFGIFRGWAWPRFWLARVEVRE